jgi:hypothetical protein
MTREPNLEPIISGSNTEFKRPATPQPRAVNRTTSQLDGFSAKLEPRRDGNSLDERIDDWHSDIDGEDFFFA